MSKFSDARSRDGVPLILGCHSQAPCSLLMHDQGAVQVGLGI